MPERADYIPIIVGELQRIASHCVFLGTYGIDIGAYTPFLVAFGRERERILDLFEEICGARLTYNYIRIGGVLAEAPRSLGQTGPTFVIEKYGRSKEYHMLLTYNSLFIDLNPNNRQKTNSNG